MKYSTIKGGQFNVEGKLNKTRLDLQAHYYRLKCVHVLKSMNDLESKHLLFELRYSSYFHNYNTRHSDLLRLSLA